MCSHRNGSQNMARKWNSSHFPGHSVISATHAKFPLFHNGLIIAPVYTEEAKLSMDHSPNLFSHQWQHQMIIKHEYLVTTVIFSMAPHFAPHQNEGVHYASEGLHFMSYGAVVGSMTYSAGACCMMWSTDSYLEPSWSCEPLKMHFFPFWTPTPDCLRPHFRAGRTTTVWTRDH